MYDRKDEEYAADFIAISRRTLTQDEFRLFNYHFLLGAEWKLCCARLKIDRGNFFHAIYRVQQKLGKAFRETEPHGIFPVYSYYEDQRMPAEALALAEALATDPAEDETPRIRPGRTVYPYHVEDPPARRRRIA